MTHTDGNQHHQPWGVPRPRESSLLVEASLEEFMTSQLERVAAALNKLEARLDADVLRVSATQATPHPIPAPPFSAPRLASGYYPRPEPDPPDGPPLNATAQPPYAHYEPPTYTVPDTYIAHQQHHPYLARQPTCWDPPWSSQTTSYQPEQQDRAWDYAYGPPSYQHAEPSWKQHNPCLGTPPWQSDHTVLYPSIPPPLPQRPLSWDPTSFQPLATALLPAAVAPPPHAYDSRQPSRLHLPSSMNEVISDPDPNLFCFKSLVSPFHTEECFLKLNSSTQNMCSIENTFEDNVKDLEKESENERKMSEESHNFDDKSINNGAFDADDKLIPQRSDTLDRSLDSTVRSSLMGPSMEQLQSEQVDKIKERSCPEHLVVVRKPLLRSTSPYSALTPTAAAVPRPPQPHPPFYSRSRFVTDKDRIWEEVPRNVVVAIGANVASINHRSTTLDTDGRLIPPRNDMSCTIMYCHKFLLTKYDEKAEVADALGGWSCSTYVGIWNCIVCITKKDDTDEKSKKAKNAFFSTVDVLTLRRLCASLEHLHTFDPGGEVSPKLMSAMIFIVLWFPP
ncbi:uncharacterized protein LOC121763707 [Salvia splendens]|uniref:uncharacterized protein LOC121763707 n=1 Tax=Salvia splendens TaxID=180675 RepID=UPI001C262378|nr:uncharacterized protein LOC121763707 [Salvia splendens]